MKGIHSYTFKFLKHSTLVHPIVAKPPKSDSFELNRHTQLYTTELIKANKRDKVNAVIAFTSMYQAEDVIKALQEDMHSDDDYGVVTCKVSQLMDHCSQLNMPLVTIISSYCTLHQPDVVPALFDFENEQLEMSDATETYEIFYHYRPLERSSLSAWLNKMARHEM